MKESHVMNKREKVLILETDGNENLKRTLRELAEKRSQVMIIVTTNIHES